MRKGKFFQKKENLLFVTLLTCFLMLLAGCSGGGGSNSTEEPNQVPEDNSSTVTLTGNAAKGPFVPGASVQVYEILDNGTRGELLKSSTITSLLGDYSVTLESNACDYVLVEVTGKYFQETDGKNSTANATLKAVFKPGSVDKINGNINGNINIATTLAAERFMYLLQQGKDKDEAYELANANALNFITSVLDINSTEIDKLKIENSTLNPIYNFDITNITNIANAKFLILNAFLVEQENADGYIQKIENKFKLSPWQTFDNTASVNIVKKFTNYKTYLDNIKKIGCNATISELSSDQKVTVVSDVTGTLDYETSSNNTVTINIKTDLSKKEAIPVQINEDNSTISAEVVTPDYTYGAAEVNVSDGNASLYLFVDEVDSKKTQAPGNDIEECKVCQEAIINKVAPKVISSSDNKARMIVGDMALDKDITVAITPYESAKFVPLLNNLPENATVVSGADIHVYDSNGKVVPPDETTFCADVQFLNFNMVSLPAEEIIDGDLSLYVYKEKKWQKVNATVEKKEYEGDIYFLTSSARLRLYPYVIVYQPSSLTNITISGQVTDTSDNPIPGALVLLNKGEGFTVSDQNGNYTIEYNLAGTNASITLTCQKDGYNEKSTQITLLNNNTEVTQNFSLQSANLLTIKGKVTGTFASSAQLELTNSTFTYILYPEYDGSFEFKDVIDNSSLASWTIQAIFSNYESEKKYLANCTNANGTIDVGTLELKMVDYNETIEQVKDVVSHLFENATLEKSSLTDAQIEDALEKIDKAIVAYPEKDEFKAYKAFLQSYDLVYGGNEFNTLLNRLGYLDDAESMITGLAKIGSDTFYPQDIQYYKEIFTEDVLKRIDDALNSLGEIKDTTITFPLRIGSTEYEGDYSDILCFKAALNFARAIIHYGLAHNLDVEGSKNDTSFVEALTDNDSSNDPSDKDIFEAEENSDLFKFNDAIDYKTYLQEAKAEVSTALDLLKAAIESILKETDSQGDDLITFETDREKQQAQDLLTTLTDLKNSLSKDTVVHWNKIEEVETGVEVKKYLTTGVNLGKAFDGSVSFRDFISSDYTSSGELYISEHYLEKTKLNQIFTSVELEPSVYKDNVLTYEPAFWHSASPYMDFFAVDYDESVPVPEGLTVETNEYGLELTWTPATSESSAYYEIMVYDVTDNELYSYTTSWYKYGFSNGYEPLYDGHKYIFAVRTILDGKASNYSKLTNPVEYKQSSSEDTDKYGDEQYNEDTSNEDTTDYDYSYDDSYDYLDVGDGLSLVPYPAQYQDTNSYVAYTQQIYFYGVVSYYPEPYYDSITIENVTTGKSYTATWPTDIQFICGPIDLNIGQKNILKITASGYKGTVEKTIYVTHTSFYN